MKSEIIKTADGSHTLFVKELNEQYHSVNGAITESMHVFITNAFLFRNKNSTTVFEVGFGTGLNCLLTAIKANELHIKIKYISVEKYPLKDNLIKQLNYSSIIGSNSGDIWQKIHHADWNNEVQISDSFKLHKLKLDLTACTFPETLSKFDVIYFDAFAPDIQPEMWQPEIFNILAENCNSSAVITTYSAKGEVRRKMMASGFKMEKLPGPPGKKEMLRGIITN
ncbi:MAG: tRNA (5-methylaminomethyl-2-thiouridine)(34)-methyltransferase MnmD [Mariniphaga sp.]|nr:tRNA (5-methylaminomethyl-2-thiouridine)(34)-methyltransferase MnmD [Mariniphaga sp.]